MNSKLILTALFVGLGLQACAAEATAEGDAIEESAEAELTSTASLLVGQFELAGDSSRPPTFDSIAFNSDGTFVADVDTGIRCITAPCPSSVHLAGAFSATRTFITLTPSGDRHAFYGRYRYSLADGKLSLRRDGAQWNAWTNELARKTAAIWPTDRLQLVAQQSGGGFAPPPPAGSTCGLGARKFTLDIGSHVLFFEKCVFVNGALHLQVGTKTLTAADVAKVDAAMNQVTVSKLEICGADKPFVSIKVTSASQGEKTYNDSFYSCNGGDKTYVDNIDGPLRTLGDLSQ